MTVVKQATGVIRLGNGATTSFPVPFSATRPEDIYVERLVGNVGTRVPPSQYTISINRSAETATVVTNFHDGPLASGERIFIGRETQPTQEVVVNSQTAYDPAIVMQVWDKLTRLGQELTNGLARAAKVPVGIEDPEGLVTQQFSQDVMDLANIQDGLNSLIGIINELIHVSQYTDDIAAVAVEAQNLYGYFQSLKGAAAELQTTFLYEEGKSVYTHDDAGRPMVVSPAGARIYANGDYRLVIGRDYTINADGRPTFLRPFDDGTLMVMDYLQRYTNNDVQQVLLGTKLDADRAEAAAQIAEDVIGGPGALQVFVAEAEGWADAAEGFADAAELAASDAANDANAQIAPNVAAAVSAKNAAEAAADASIQAGQWDQEVADEAARLALTGLATNWQVYQLDTEHVWRWDGSAWVDRGVSPLALKENKANAEQKALSLGEQIGTPGNAVAVTALNGAIAGLNKFTIPVGQTGIGSFVRILWKVDGSSVAGRTLRYTMRYKRTVGFSQTLYVNFQVFATSAQSRAAKFERRDVGDYVDAIWTYTMRGDETDIRPFLSIPSVADAVSVEQSLELVSVVPTWLSGNSGIETLSDEAFEKRVQLKLAAYSDQIRFGLGNLAGRIGWQWTNILAGGAVANGSNSIRVPAGQTGSTSYLQGRWDFDGAPLAGKRIQVRIGLTTSSPFTRTLGALFFQIQTGSGWSNRAVSVDTKIMGNRRIITAEYLVQGDEIRLQPLFSMSGATPTATDETISYDEFVFYILDSPSDIQTLPDYILSQLITVNPNKLLGYSGVDALKTQSEVTSGNGQDYNDAQEAVAAVSGSFADRKKVLVKGRQVLSTEIFDKDFVDISGTGFDESELYFSQPDNASAANLGTYSPIRQQRHSRLEGLRITAKNARYGIHLESSGQLPDRIQEITNCHVEHLGNDSASNNTWQSQFAVGSGLSSGQVVRLRGSTFLARNNGAFAYHTNVGFSAPTMVDAEGCTFACDAANGVGSGFAFRIQPMGSGQRDQCRLVGNSFTGDIQISVSPWGPSALKDQPADHCEVAVWGHSNSAAVFRNHDFGRALRIDSSTTGSGSSVEVSGDAVKWLFGDGESDKYTTREGSAGFKAAVWGWGDVSGTAVGVGSNVFITSLGQRLGDCSVTAKTLTVVVDGGAPIDVVFNQNHTAQSNATVLGIINSALGSAATASLYAPGQRYRPRFSDEERTLRNTSGSGIPFGTVLAWDATVRHIRPMTSADSADLFAGVAWEDIEAGKRGRVKTSGWLHISDVRRADSAAITFGTTFSISATAPGTVVVGGSQGLLRAIRSDAVQVRPK